MTIKADTSNARKQIKALSKEVSLAGKTVNGISKGFSSLKSSIMNIKTAIAGLAATTGIVAVGKSVLDTAASFETYRKQLLIVTKDQKVANEAFKELSEWAAKNPVDTDDAVKAFVKLKTASVANTKEAVMALGNLAAMTNSKINDVADSLVTMNAKSLRQYGIQVSTAGEQATIKIGNTVKTVNKDIDSMRAALVQAIGSEFGEAMEQMKNTWTGNLNTMGGLWTQLKSDLAGSAGSGGPFDLIRGMMIKLRMAWEEWMGSDSYKTFLDSFKVSFASVVQSSVRGIGVLMEKLSDLFEYVADNAKTLGYTYAGAKAGSMFGPMGTVMGGITGGMLSVKDNIHYVDAADSEEQAMNDLVSGNVKGNGNLVTVAKEKQKHEFLDSMRSKGQALQGFDASSVLAFTAGLDTPVKGLGGNGGGVGAASGGSGKKYTRSALDVTSELMGQGLFSAQEMFDTLAKTIEDYKGKLYDMNAEGDEARKRFAAMQSAGQKLAQEAVEQLNTQFESGTITIDTYQARFEELMQKYADFPNITKMLNKSLEDMANKAVPATEKGIKSLNELTLEWVKSFQSGITDAIVECGNFGETLSNLGKQLEKMALNMMLWGGDGKSGLLGGMFSGLFKSAKGSAWNGGVQAFAKGGVVSSPTLFKFANGTGLMGEAGPEAIMPLERDSSGRLGVRLNGGAGGGVFAPQVNVTVNNSGSGNMSDEQAKAMSRELREVVDARVAENLYNYKRRGFFRGAMA